MEDYYRILGCDYDCDEAQIRSAYRAMAKNSHPDHGGETVSFVKVKEAFDTLSDSEMRARYDREIGIREFEGRRYRTTKPSRTIRSERDIYDDIKEAVKTKAGSELEGGLYVEIDEDEIVVNSDGVVLLAPVLEIVCPACMGFGGWLGNCDRCVGSGRAKTEELIPFHLEGVLTADDRFSFQYKKFKVQVKVV